MNGGSAACRRSLITTTKTGGVPVGWLIIIAIAITIYLYIKHLQQFDTRSTDLSHLPERFIVFDLETTGLNPSRNKIIEIGAIRAHRDSDNHDTFQCFIKIDGAVPGKITEITGITTEMVKAGEPIDSALVSFTEFIGELRLVSFNANFDISFLNAALNSCGMPQIKNEVSCALDMARRAWPERKSYKLKDLAKDANLGAQNHRALSDCQLALLIYAGAAAKLRRVS